MGLDTIFGFIVVVKKIVAVFKRFFLLPIMPLFLISKHYYGKRYNPKDGLPQGKILSYFFEAFININRFQSIKFGLMAPLKRAGFHILLY